MAIQVIMPTLGESFASGTISRWLKQPGETVQEYEPLLEVSTDKVDTEIPAPASGVLLAIHAPAGSSVAAGTLLGLIGTIEEAPAAQAATAGETREYAGPVTPVVARMAAEHNLDLAQIAGTGRGGRVTKKDVEAYLAAQAARLPASPPPTLPPPPPARPSEPVAPAEGSERVPLTAMRRTIADHMARSAATAPHVTTVFEVDLSAVLKHREAQRESFARQGANLTLTAYFAAAVVTALRTNPYLNATWTDDGIILHRAVHLGIAVALDDGLIVPVIRSAHRLNLLGLALAINDLATRARAGKLQPADVQGGTFTITNHGVSGSLLATPIIHQPQAAILGVGAVEKRVKVVGDDAIAIRPCAYMTLTFDHRVADGAAGDALLAALKHALEHWPAEP